MNMLPGSRGTMGEQFQEFFRDCANNLRHHLRVNSGDMTSGTTQAMAQRKSIALLKAQFNAPVGRARVQQPNLMVSFRSTTHTAAALCHWGSTIGSSCHPLDGVHQEIHDGILYAITAYGFRFHSWLLMYITLNQFIIPK